MSRVHHIDLRCEIDPHSESIHGEMSVRQGKPLPFSGWTEFAGALVSLASREVEEARAGDETEIQSIEEEEKY